MSIDPKGDRGKHQAQRPAGVGCTPVETTHEKLGPAFFTPHRQGQTIGMGIDPDPFLLVLGKNAVVLEARVELQTKVLARPIPRAHASHPVLEQPRLALEEVDSSPGVAKQRKPALPQAQVERRSVKGYRQSMLTRLPAEAQVFQRKAVPPFSRKRVNHKEGLAVAGCLAKHVGLALRHMPIDVVPERR